MNIHKLSLIALFSLVTSASLSAEVLPAFFNTDGAKTVFEGPIETTERREALMLVPKKEPKKEELAKTKQDDSFENKKASADLAKLTDNTDYRLSQPKSKEDILKTFGDPSKPFPVSAVKDAPTPFRGLMAALNAGDEELAFKYAIQYTRYQEAVKNNVHRANAFIGHAKTREGVLPEGSWADSDAYAQYSSLRDLELKDMDNVNDNYEISAKIKETNINKEANELMQRLKNSSFKLFDEEKKLAKKDLDKWGEEERVRVRQELAGKLPKSQSGKLDILYFFKHGDKNLSSDLQELSKFVSANAKDKRVQVNGLLISTSLTGIETLKEANKVNFPILPGLALSQKLGLRKSPVLILTTDQGVSHIESSSFNFFRIDEIRKIMQGVQ